MEVKIGDRRFKMIDGKVYIVRFSCLGVEVKSGKFTPIKFCDHSDGYNQCSLKLDGRQIKLYEHRLVWKLANPDWDLFDSSKDNFIDHKNRNKKDNRLENLHLVNQRQNTWNRDAKGFHLVSSGKYEAKLMVDGVQKYLGTFATEEEAHSSYLQGKIKYHPIV